MTDSLELPSCQLPPISPSHSIRAKATSASCNDHLDTKCSTRGDHRDRRTAGPQDHRREMKAGGTAGNSTRGGNCLYYRLGEMQCGGVERNPPSPATMRLRGQGVWQVKANSTWKFIHSFTHSLIPLNSSKTKPKTHPPASPHQTRGDM